MKKLYLISLIFLILTSIALGHANYPYGYEKIEYIPICEKYLPFMNIKELLECMFPK